MKLSGILVVTNLSSTKPGDLVVIHRRGEQLFAIVAAQPSTGQTTLAFISGDSDGPAGEAKEMSSGAKCLSYGSEWVLQAHDEILPNIDEGWRSYSEPVFAHTDNGPFLFVTQDFDLACLNLNTLNWEQRPSHVAPIQSWSIWRSEKDMNDPASNPLYRGVLTKDEDRQSAMVGIPP